MEEWQLCAQAEGMARAALQRLLTDYYGVSVDAAWLHKQGVDTNMLLAHPVGAAEAPLVPTQQSHNPLSTAVTNVHSAHANRAAAQPEPSDRSVFPGLKSSRTTAQSDVGRDESPLQQQDVHPKRGGVLGFFGL